MHSPSTCFFQELLIIVVQMLDLLCVHPTGVTVYKEVLHLTDKLP